MTTFAIFRTCQWIKESENKFRLKNRLQTRGQKIDETKSLNWQSSHFSSTTSNMVLRFSTGNVNDDIECYPERN